MANGRDINEVIVIGWVEMATQVDGGEGEEGRDVSRWERDLKGNTDRTDGS